MESFTALTERNLAQRSSKLTAILVERLKVAFPFSPFKIMDSISDRLMTRSHLNNEVILVLEV
jgi:hypothetical protein